MHPANLRAVAITTVEARGQILDELAGATIQIGFAVGCLGAAYELLDEMMDFGYPQTTETKILQEYALFLNIYANLN